jgi:hypothetical protein
VSSRLRGVADDCAAVAEHLKRQLARVANVLIDLGFHRWLSLPSRQSP